ncbi:MAG: RsmB/NOP family class I SAM-dependent RNA methyltransferase [Desulfurococcaceae archaeon TW002]
MKEPYNLRWVDVAALIDAVKLAESTKPSQQAKRTAFKKYGILGTKHDPPLTAIFHSIMLRLGLIDNLIKEFSGVLNPLLLDSNLRAALRVFISLMVFSKERVRFEDLNKIKNKVAQHLSKSSHPFTGIWFWDLIDKLTKYEYKPKTSEEELTLKYLLPAWYIKKMSELIGEEEAAKLFESFLKTPKISVRVNTLKATVDEIFKELKESKVRDLEVSQVVPTVIKFKGPYNFDKSSLMKEGKIIIQDESAALAVILLDPKPGHVVVDLAAAPGGKTEFIGELMRNEGIIYAFDVDPKRIRRMQKLLEKTGITIVKIYEKDGREAPRIIGENVADRVLVDPPCSSDGTLMKNHDLRWRLMEDEVPKLAQLQYELLLAGLKILKPGGYLLYSTCSLLKEENEDVILRVIKKKKGRIVPIKGPYGEGFIEGTMRVWPHKHNTTGFFYALLTKGDVT